MKRAVLFAVIFFVAPAAHAAFTSGKQLSQGCGKRDMAGEFFCMAYISGVLDSNSQCGPYTFSLREAMGIILAANEPCLNATRVASLFNAGSCRRWRRCARLNLEANKLRFDDPVQTARRCSTLRQDNHRAIMCGALGRTHIEQGSDVVRGELPTSIRSATPA